MINIVIPMAGKGKRMRPHTLTTPKPLIPIAGKPLVHRLVEDIAKICGTTIGEIAFVVGHFGEEAEKELLEIAASVGAVGHICYQEEALGTAHAILCGQQVLKGNTVVAYADTLFKAGFELDTHNDASIWVQKVANPSDFGVVKLDSAGNILGMVEKPKEFVSDLAIIGIYYFKDGENFKQELQYLLDNDIKVGTEYQITDALDNMNKKGVNFKPTVVQEWLDCGNPSITVQTNSRYLSYLNGQNLIHSSVKLVNSTIIEPVSIESGSVIENSVIGPGVSIGKNTHIVNSIVKNALIQNEVKISDCNIEESLIGNNTEVTGQSKKLNLGDFSQINI